MQAKYVRLSEFRAKIGEGLSMIRQRQMALKVLRHGRHVATVIPANWTAIPPAKAKGKANGPETPPPSQTIAGH